MPSNIDELEVTAAAAQAEIADLLLSIGVETVGELRALTLTPIAKQRRIAAAQAKLEAAQAEYDAAVNS